MLPNVLQPSATDHVPVLAAEVRESLAVSPGDTVIDATFGAGGHAGLIATDLVQNGTFVVAKAGSTSAVAVLFGAFSGSGGFTGGGDESA